MSDKLSNPSARASSSPVSTASEKMIFKWVTLLDVHYNRRELFSPEEKKIYIEGLREYPHDRLESAFHRAMHECEFMPKVADIVKRLPDVEPKSYHESGDFVPIKDWYEPYTSTSKLHIWQDIHGNKRVAPVKLKDGERPPQIGPDAPEDQMSWAEAWAKIKGISRDKTL